MAQPSAAALAWGAGALAAAASIPSASVRLAYGTAGFRADAKLLPAIFLRMGMLAALRSLSHAGQAIGVMVTASHNGIEDNGVKMVDADGGMLAQAWERHACALADAPASDVAATLARIAATEGITLPPSPAALVPVIILGRDTRPSSPSLAALVHVGARACGARVDDRGIVTTPQLHHVVRFANSRDEAARAAYGGLDGYVRMLHDAYLEVLAGAPPRSEERGPLVLDCAQGVGAVSAAELARSFEGVLCFELRNTGETPEDAARLNEGCGAEHVQKGRLPPAGFDAHRDVGARCASLDGDADRVVYHAWRGGVGGEGAPPQWHLLDGDKIACLAAAFIGGLLSDAGLSVTAEPSHAGHDSEAPHSSGAAAGGAPPPASALAALRAAPVSVGVVQTAYANGASSAFMRETLRLPVLIAKTGVKFVHAAAAAFDVGIYFEANGHGTVLFHPSFALRLKAAVDAGVEVGGDVAAAAAAHLALRRLYWTSVLINQAVGDALSDALFVEVVLTLRGWDWVAWDGLYEDLPSRQCKLAVRDRAVVMTTPDETRVTAPASLQTAIDALVTAAAPHSRAFVRPSGTEDVVRVYAEAATAARADALAADVARAAWTHAGGVGASP